MSHSPEDERITDDLRHVADVLRDGRPTLDPLALDRVKLRAMSAGRRFNSTRRPKGSPMKQRFATVLTAALLILGTGGTLALAGGGDGAGGGGSASFHQYKPPCDHKDGEDRDCHGHKGEEGDKGKGGDKGGNGGGDKGGHGQGGGDKGGQGGGGDKGHGQGGGDKGGQDHGGGKGGPGHHH